MATDDLLGDSRVRRVLELAAVGTQELEVPWELRDAVQWCIASELVKLQRAALVAQAPFPDSWLKAPDTLVVIPPSEGRAGEAANWLLLTSQGGKELLRLRLKSASTPAEHEWSGAKSPAEWRRELKISETTWRRYTNAKDGVLIVEKINGNSKNVRIRLDTLRKLQGT